MSGFRIGAPALPAKDVAYIRALVRLFAYTEKLDWSYADKAPYTALVAPSESEAGRNPASLVLIMLDNVHERHTIAYPIRADQLRDWLKRMAQSLLSLGPRPGASLALPAANAPAQTAAAAVKPFAPPPSSPDAKTFSALPRYKLRRWPAPALLGGDNLRIQMATLLSRRHVNATELAALAGASLQQAGDFIAALEAAALLLDAPIQAPPEAAAPVSAAVEVPRTGFGIAGITSSLLDNIRRRMGRQGEQ